MRIIIMQYQKKQILPLHWGFRRKKYFFPESPVFIGFFGSSAEKTIFLSENEKMGMELVVYKDRRTKDQETRSGSQVHIR